MFSPLSAENLGLDHLRVKIRRLVDSTGTDHHRNLPGVRTVRPIDSLGKVPKVLIFSRDTASSNNACVEEDAYWVSLLIALWLIFLGEPCFGLVRTNVKGRVSADLRCLTTLLVWHTFRRSGMCNCVGLSRGKQG